MTRRRHRTIIRRWSRNLGERFKGTSSTWWEHPRSYVPNLSHFSENEYPTPCMGCGYDPRGLAARRCPECGRPRYRSRDLAAYYVRRELPEQATPRRWFKRLEHWHGNLILIPSFAVIIAYAAWWVANWGAGPASEPAPWIEQAWVFSMLAIAPVGLITLLTLFFWQRYQRFRQKGGAYDCQITADRDVAPFNTRRERVLNHLRLPRTAQRARDAAKQR
jgi:hypothetical protein